MTSEQPRRVLDFQPTLTHDPALWLRFVSESYSETATFPRCMNLWTLRRHLLESGATLLPRIVWLGDRPALRGAAAVYRDSLDRDRLAGWLNARETIGALWWRRETARTSLEVPCGSGRLVLSVRQSGRRLTFRGDSVDPTVHLSLRLRAAVRQIDSGCSIAAEEISQNPHLLREIAGLVRQQAEDALRAARRLNVDFLNIGYTLRDSRPELWRALTRVGARPHVPEVLQYPVTIEVHPVIGESGTKR